MGTSSVILSRLIRLQLARKRKVTRQLLAKNIEQLYCGYRIYLY